MVTHPSSAYLQSACDAGLLYEFAGHPYVAGSYEDPVSGDLQYLVEYCDAGLLDVPDGVSGLFQELTARFLDPGWMRIRVRSAVRLPRPWEPAVTYLRFSGTPAVTHPDDIQVTIARAGDEHDLLVEEWLSRALCSGYAMQNRPVDATKVRATSSALLALTGRCSYVALVEGAAVGHLTLLDDAVDEVTAEEYVDLFDMLVEPGTHAPAARRGLVAAAASHAGSLSKALIGNVVHPQDASDVDQGQTVVDALCERGWQIDHVDWRRHHAG